MTAKHETICVRTRGKGTYEITDEVARAVRESGVRTGTVTVFIRHTSASLVIYENADPSARTTSRKSPPKMAITLTRWKGRTIRQAI